MNWEAIGSLGEVAGATGVLLTLIYFGIQIRKSQEASIVSSLSTAHLAAINVESKFEDCAPLLCKANRGEDLTEEESYRLERLAAILSTDAFYNYMRVSTRNGVTENLVFNFAYRLSKNPGLCISWENYEDELQKHRGSDRGQVGEKWVNEVKAELARIGT